MKISESIGKMADYAPYPSNIQLDPLHNECNIIALNNLTKVIKTSIGPHGKLKMIQNISGGHVTVTSASQRLFYNLSIKNTLLKLIVSSVKTHIKSYGDGGLFCGLLIVELMKYSLNLTYPLPLVGRLYETFSKLYIDCLNVDTNACIFKLNISSLHDLQSFVSSILNSKPGCILTEDDKLHVSAIILKAFLNVIPTSSPFIFFDYAIHFVTLGGVNARESKLYDGLLLRNTEMTQALLERLKRTSKLKTVLFTISLSGDVDFPTDKIEIDSKSSIWDATVKYLLCFVDQLINMDVDFVACQKVIHPKLRKRMEDNRILVLDRLGGETAKYLEFLLGVPAITSLSISNIEFGIVSSISEEKIGLNSFLLLHTEVKPFSTILICNYQEEAFQETKHICQQVIDGLFRLLKDQKVCYGAGCTEIFTCHLLEKKVKETLNEISEEVGCKTSQILEILKIFQQSLYSTSLSIHQGTVLDFTSESTFNHLWKLKDGNFPTAEDKCMCGKHDAKSVNSGDWHFLTRSNHYILLDNETFKFTKQDMRETNANLILDELSCKINAVSIAFETASMLLRVSLCISS